METDRANLTVLIVDDEPVVRHLLKSLLGKEGYGQIAEVETGEACLEALDKKRFDVVLLDKNLPGISGLDVLEQTRGLRPGTQFIVITAYGSLDSALKALELGAHGFLTKPFANIETVITHVQAAAEQAHAHRRQAKILVRIRGLTAGLTDPTLCAELGALLDELDQLRGRAAPLTRPG